MSEPFCIRISQDIETPLQVETRPPFVFRYACARSADSIAANDSGQDYLMVCGDDMHLAFAICDGVSQSFYGNIAAKLLGEALTAWWIKVGPALDDSRQIKSRLEHFLNEFTAEASRQFSQFKIIPQTAPLVLNVLEKKREQGSQSMFVSGLLDVPKNKVILAWMGDSRLRLWDLKEETTHLLENNLLTAERWSTHKGLLGELHLYTCRLGETKRIVAYSDGLVCLDEVITFDTLRNEEINHLIDQARSLPTSDDISFIEICPISAKGLENSAR